MPPLKNIRYIALLRAVNVGGRVVKMERLRALFAELGLENVRTYIQSGNVFFDAPAQNRQNLQLRIENHLSAALEYEVPVFLRTLVDFEKALAMAPFRGKDPTGDTRHLIVFLSAPIKEGIRFPHCSPRNDCVILHAFESEAFVVIRVEKGRVPNATAFLEKALNLSSTARFYHTAEKLLAAAKDT